MDRWNLLAELAAAQYGLVAAWQAQELGITRQVLADYTEERGWTRVRHGVYLMPGLQLTPLAQLKAAELALHQEGLASHRAAGFVWGLTTNLWHPLEFLVKQDCSRRPQGTLIRQSLAMAERPGAVRSKIRVTDAEWTICTLAKVQTVPQLVRSIQIADRTRIATVPSLRTCADSLGSFHGCRRLWAALERLTSELTHSELERLARRLLSGEGLKPHHRPYAVVKGDTILGELDIAFVEQKVGIPVDGPHHFEPGQKRADDDQRHQLRLAGWLVVPVDEYRLVHEPQVFLRQVRDALRSRGYVA